MEEINKKYSRRDGYYYKGSKRYVSVTTALQCINKPALVSWAGYGCAKTALEDPSLTHTEVYAKFMDGTKTKKAGMGTRIHEISEGIEKGTIKDVENISEDLRGYVKAFQSFLKEIKPELLLSETKVYSEKYGYAGSLDRVWKIGDSIVLADIKTSKNLYKEYGLQVEAYRRGCYEMGLVEKIDKTKGLLLKPNGTFDWKEMNGDFDVFLSCLKLWRWLYEEVE